MWALSFFARALSEMRKTESVRRELKQVACFPLAAGGFAAINEKSRVVILQDPVRVVVLSS